MKKILLSLISFLVLSLGQAPVAQAGNGLWVEGKEKPKERVNVGVKSVTPDTYLKIAEKVDAAVVNIRTTKLIKGRNFLSQRRPQRGPTPRPHQPQPFDDFFERFFGGPVPDQDIRQKSLGSGFLLNAEGYVVTNNHVVDQAEEIRVVLNDETEFPAEIVGRDPKTDLALLKIDSKKKFKSVVLGNSDTLKVGEIVVAIGNPFGLSHSLTQGIVSAKERSIGFGNYDDFIQTDASINPGNSGGPLLNLHGEVIGINTAIVASGQGIGFAIPINLAKTVLYKLKEKGRVVRGWLGVHIQKVTKEHAKAFDLKKREGALVAQTAKDGPAAKAGIKSGDVIVTFDGKPVKDWHDLPILVANTSVGKKVKVGIIRDGKRNEIRVKIAELEDEVETNPKDKENDTDRLGLTVQKITPDIARSFGFDEDLKGVVVMNVDRSRPAAEKGIRRADVILEVNRIKTPTVKAYRQVVKKLKEGSSVLLLVKRGPATLFVAFTL